MQSKLRRHPEFMNNFVQLFGERYATWVNPQICSSLSLAIVLFNNKNDIHSLVI